MESLGKITDWSDDRGLGFITPLHGQQRVFFHIRDYQQSGRRPERGELVKYVASRQDGRWKATLVERAVVSTKKTRPTKSWRIPASTHFTLIAFYSFGLALAIVDHRLPIEFVFLVFGMSAIAYMAYAFDKQAAQKGLWRIPETTLHLIELLFGWPGALLAQLRLRHKTSKLSYRVEFWLMALTNLTATALWVARS